MREDLVKIYESMYEKEEPIEEGKSGHGDIGALMDLMNQAIKQGIITAKETKKGWLVRSTKDNSQELIHRGEKSYHYLRRFLHRIS